ncbi:DUF2277 family protein [Blastococcus sp. HT6-30]|uniref:DUF2277 family protein n=1 Tax=Blastococcus sp. HT6-30 TaxID=3144843 RepID=UPI0032195D61
MCRNIRPLANFEPPAATDEIRAAALQYVARPAERRSRPGPTPRSSTAPSRRSPPPRPASSSRW